MSDVSSSVSTQPHNKLGKRVSWNPFAGTALVIALYFVAPTIAAIAITLISTGVALQGVSLQFVYVLLAQAITLSVLLYYLRSNKASLKDIGLGAFRSRHIGIGMAVYPIYFIMFVLIVVLGTQLLPGLDVDQEQQLGFDNVQGIIALAMTFISLVVLPPIIEELTVRGMIFTSLRSKFTLLPAMLLTSFLFAIAHLPAGGAAGPLYIAAIDTFILSLVLCFVREKTGSLWPCITLHALKNGIAYFSLFIAPLIWVGL
jgi:uncharacterized protein